MLTNTSMQRYWTRNLIMTTALLMVWAIVSFGIPFFVTQLNEVRVGGFPTGFYLMAQGVPLIYLAIVLIYNAYVGWLDRYFGVDEEEAE